MVFQPTHVDNTPAVCFCCGAESTGIGLNGKPGQDPKWLCEDCIAAGSGLFTAARRDLRPYERQAVTRAVDAVGPFLESHGTDLADWDGDTAEQFVAAIWRACGDGLREAVKEGCPF